MENSIISISNTMNVNVIFCRRSDIRTYKAVQASTRLTQMARMLTEGNKIGLLLEGKNTGKCLVKVFSTEKSGISADDFIWAFENCAMVQPSDDQMDSYFMSGIVKRYKLNESEISNAYVYDRMMAVSSEDDLGSPVCHEPCENYLRAVTELFMMGAKIEITIDAKDEKENAVIIEVPGEIPIRIKTMLSIAFPNSELINFGAENEPLPDGQLSYSFIHGFIENTLLCLMKQYPNIDPIKSLLYSEALDDEDYASVDYIGIEDMELSIRVYNALKRAGINTIGDLRKSSESELLNTRNLGKKGFFEVVEKLMDYGISNIDLAEYGFYD